MIDLKDMASYTDCYFSKSKEALTVAKHNPTVVWQVFQKHSAIFCGLSYIMPFLNAAEEVFALADGDTIEPFEPALIIRAKAQDFIEFETVYLGILARMTKVATNVHAAVQAAAGKPVLFFPARFDVPDTQEYDGYAAAIGGARGCATQIQTNGFIRARLQEGKFTYTTRPVGTMPHALIAAFNGDTIAASLAFAEARPNEDVWVLVDFDNDCGETAVRTYEAFKAHGIEYRLKGVRLDTSEKLVDEGIKFDKINRIDGMPGGPLSGVCPNLVEHVRRELNGVGAKDVQIAVSGGFTPDKIQLFETLHLPVDVYAVGEGFFKGANAYTSDIVARYDGNNLVPCGKVGRGYKTNTRLEQILAKAEAHAR